MMAPELVSAALQIPLRSFRSFCFKGLGDGIYDIEYRVVGIGDGVDNAGSFEFYELTLFPTKRLLEIHNPPEQANCK